MDSNATRQQRYRRHKQGDHSMCKRNCRDSAVSVRIAGAVRTSEDLVEVPARSGENPDPAEGLRDLAVTLAAAYRADPGNAALARELRTTLLCLRPEPDAAQRDLFMLARELAR